MLTGLGTVGGGQVAFSLGIVQVAERMAPGLSPSQPGEHEAGGSFWGGLHQCQKCTFSHHQAQAVSPVRLAHPWVDF